MKIGRELDSIVSQEIFGAEYPFNDFFKDYVRLWVEDPIAFEDCPHYSTDISEAWKVVEKLLIMLPNQDFHIEHWADENSAGWQVSSCFELGNWKKWVKAKTLPHAICLAALKAVKK
jgi:Phage ABA sandwich domain